MCTTDIFSMVALEANRFLFSTALATATVTGGSWFYSKSKRTPSTPPSSSPSPDLTKRRQSVVPPLLSALPTTTAERLPESSPSATSWASTSSPYSFLRLTQVAKERLELLTNVAFAEGACRRAFRGRLYFEQHPQHPNTMVTSEVDNVTASPTSLSSIFQDVVVKAYKPEDVIKYPTELIDSIRAQERAIGLAKLYNEQMQGRASVIFLPIRPFVLPHAVRDPVSGSVLIASSQVVTVEPLLHGEYQKFSSNNGWVTNEVSTPGAFQHWTWHHTHELMVMDLQGIQVLPGSPSSATNTTTAAAATSSPREGSFFLTDPAICSLKEEFGSTDCGLEAIQNFFQTHQCGALCQGFEVDRPKVTPPPILGGTLAKVRQWTSGRRGGGRVRRLVLGVDKTQQRTVTTPPPQ